MLYYQSYQSVLCMFRFVHKMKQLLADVNDEVFAWTSCQLSYLILSSERGSLAMNGEAMPIAYCVSCWEHEEEYIKDSIHTIFPDVTVLIPQIERSEKHQGKWESKFIKLTPGYVFLFSFSPIPVEKLTTISKVTRVLFYVESRMEGSLDIRTKAYPLRGDDRAFANWIYNNQGVIRISVVKAEKGKQIVITKGPIKELETKIKRVDKHNRKVLVTNVFNKEELEIWLSFDWDNT